MATFSDTSYEDKKLSSYVPVTTADVVVNDGSNITVLDNLNSLRAMIVTLRTELVTKDSIDVSKTNAFIDKLEADLAAFETAVGNQISTLQTSLNNTLNADITAISGKITALKTFLNDEDPANSFLSFVEYSNQATAKINELNAKTYKRKEYFVGPDMLPTYVVNGLVTIPNLPSNEKIVDVIPSSMMNGGLYVSAHKGDRGINLYDNRYLNKPLSGNFMGILDALTIITEVLQTPVADLGEFTTALVGV